MAHLEDRWERRLPDGSKARTSRHGTGDRWRARFLDPTGAERSKSFARKVDAERFLVSVEGDKLRGAYVDPRAGRTTLAEYAGTWLAALGRRESTAANYGSHLRTHILPLLGHRPLAAITPTEVRGFVRQVSGRLAPSTAVTVHTVLSAVMRAAVADRLIAVSPCPGTRPPRPQRREVVPLTVEQVGSLLEVVDPRYRGVVAVGAGVGLRLSEVLGLRPARVDFLRRRVDVREQQVLPTGRPPELGPLKTAASERTVPLPSTVADELVSHMARYPAAPGVDLLFTSASGGAVRRTAFHETPWVNAVRAAGLPPGTRFHDLRHTYASLLIAAGEHPKVIQSRLGHSSITETMDVYGHLWPSAEEATRAAVDAAFAALTAP